MKTIVVLGTTILLSITLAGCSKPRAATPPAGIMVDTKFQKALADEFTRDREVIVDYVELPPNTTMDRHYHPGEEFHYYLEGEVDLMIDGLPAITGRPGTVAHVPFKKMHTVITRAKGAKIVVFRVHLKGEPVRYLEQNGAKVK
jgi:quercetin dioxygenase-like cupin family protein